MMLNSKPTNLLKVQSFVKILSHLKGDSKKNNPACHRPECDPCDVFEPSKTVRSHTDLKCPDFSPYLRDSCREPSISAAESDTKRKLFTYMLSGTLLTASLYGIKSEVTRYVDYMATSADVLAMAKVEVKLDQIPEDKHIAVKWRGKPLFVWHRPDEAVRKVRAIPINTLRDPQKDEDRVKDPKWLVVLGVCTHLGCVPIAHQGDFGGYYCPCHGSHFDISGRARKGPAPTNLHVPEYTISGHILTVG